MISIVAICQDNGIGKDGQLLRPISNDLKRFKKITMGKVLIYGRKTLDTFPGKKVLPGRLNLILSRSLKEGEVKDAVICDSIPSLLAKLEALKAEGRTEDDFCVIGGASVYESLLPYTHAVNLTRLDAVYPADSYFPDLPEEGFVCKEESPWQMDGDLRYRYEYWERI